MGILSVYRRGGNQVRKVGRGRTEGTWKGGEELGTLDVGREEERERER